MQQNSDRLVRIGRVRITGTGLCETQNMAAASILQQPFVQVDLPIIIALMLAAWMQNKRFDDLNQRISDLNQRISEFRSDVNQRLERIETKLDHHNERITRLEERTSLVR
jgi:hypothetical protein